MLVSQALTPERWSTTLQMDIPIMPHLRFTDDCPLCAGNGVWQNPQVADLVQGLELCPRCTDPAQPVEFTAGPDDGIDYTAMLAGLQALILTLE